MKQPVDTLPGLVSQIQVIHYSAGPNNGEYAELILLCDDGTVWCQYRSNGYSNVPTDGKFYPIA